MNGACSSSCLVFHSLRTLPGVSGEAGDEPDAAGCLFYRAERGGATHGPWEDGGWNPVVHAEDLREEQAAWTEARTRR